LKTRGEGEREGGRGGAGKIAGGFPIPLSGAGRKGGGCRDWHLNVLPPDLDLFLVSL